MKYLKYLHYILVLLFLVIPIAIQGNSYIVGGDDMKLFYVFPKEYLQHFTFNLITENALAGALTGYSTVAYFAPFYATILVLKTLVPFVNTQALMYGLNFALGYFFFYKLLDLFISEKDSNFKLEITKIIASLFYIFSPLFNETFYSHQMMQLYLISIVPCVLYFFIQGIYSSNIRYVLIAVVIFSIFSTTYNAMPYFGAYLVALSPLFLYFCITNIKRFIRYSLIAGIVFLGLNFYWIFHLVNSSLNNTGLTGAFSGESFAKENIRIASGVSQLFSPLNQVFITMIPGSYQISLWSMFNIFFVSVIVIAATLQRKKHHFYPVLLLCFLVAWFFFSPNIGEWGPKLFVWLTGHVPFWGMFRNMYDKFAPAFAITYSLTFGYAFYILLSQFKKNSKVYVLPVIALILIFSHVPKLLNPYTQDRLGISRFSGEFNQDFSELVSFLHSQNNESRILILPLNAPTYVTIKDAYTENVYTGLSPTRVLADRTDYTGRFSFLTQRDIFLGDKVFKLLENKEYQQIGEILQQMNIRYIIVDNQEVPYNLRSFYYGGEELPIYDAQNADFKNEVLGSLIRDFGSTYSLYEINEKYMNDKFMTTNGSVTYTKLNSSEYQIELSNVTEDTDLVFLEPFNTQWNLYFPNGAIYKEGQNEIVYDYANKWTINSSDSAQIKSNMNDDGSYNITFRLFFEPQKYNIFIYSISIATLACVMLFLISPLYYKK